MECFARVWFLYLWEYVVYTVLIIQKGAIMSKNKLKKMISLEVKDQPISKVLETIQKSLELNLIYSKTVLSTEQGN